MTANSNFPNPTPVWRFLVPLIFQAALILAVPAQAIYTHFSGRTVILQTIPVDPYDLLRGYSQTLRYDISRVYNLKNLPGWDTLVKQVRGEKGKSLPAGTRFYVILEAPTSSTSEGEPPQAWKPVAVSRDRPLDLSPNQVALQGKKSNYTWIDYGLETYYMPEDQRNDINAHISQTLGWSGQERPFVVEVKVDSQGKAAAVSLWVSDRNYRF
ncbi:MAG: GDYXXLXY domain-containing protein [Xenococcaceae cyanobacterium]